MGKELKTNAMRFLDKSKIPYTVNTYECDEFIDGVTVANALGQPVDITFKTLVAKGKSGSYSFDIEGRDNNKSDYRYYNLSVTLTSIEYGNVSEAFTDVVNGTANDSFLIPDKNDNPDSFKKYTYNFSCDDVNNGKSWELTDSDETSKTVTVHLNFIPVGDVNGDGHIDGVDAPDILTAYAKESAGGKSDLSAAQKKAADVNGDKVMDGNDASLLLSYYAYVSAKGNVTLAEFMADRV